jgi:hypothetical protein
MTREEFVADYMARSGIANYTLRGEQVQIGGRVMWALPCNCDEEICCGWQMAHDPGVHAERALAIDCLGLVIFPNEPEWRTPEMILGEERIWGEQAITAMMDFYVRLRDEQAQREIAPPQPAENFQCEECSLAEPFDCLKASHCKHRDGPSR